MDTASFLHEAAQMPYGERTRLAVKLGRRGADADVRAVIAELEQGGFYERRLALQSCFTSRDGEHALRALADPSRAIRNLALNLVALICADAQVARALAALDPAGQRRLLRKLARRQRRAPIDAFLTLLAQRDDPLLTICIPYGSPAFVARLLARALPTMGHEDWRRLAIWHPALAAEQLTGQARSAGQFDQRLLWLANAVLPALATCAPDAALELVRALLPQVALAQLNLRLLAQHRPAEVAELLLAGSDQIALDLGRLVHRLDPARLDALLARGALRQPGAWLERLRPALRQQAYTTAGLGWRDSSGALPLTLAALLPGQLRVQEARRCLALPALQTRPAQRLPYATLLPWDEARVLLDPVLRHPDPELRAIALPALIGCGRYQNSQLPSIVQLVRERRNEQDPVRGAMISALAALPPWRWRAEQLADLGQIVRDALDAADCSLATASAAERLIVGLLPFHPAWSAGWLATLVQERGRFSSYDLSQRLTDADVPRIAPALLPVLQAWEAREREEAIFQVAAIMGRRLRAFPELIDMLERLTSDRRGWVASRALAFIAARRPVRTRGNAASQPPSAIVVDLHDRLATLVPRLIAEDPSWVTQPVVYGFLHRRRQDLLTPFLGQTAYSGRFSTGNTRFVLPLRNGFSRWTPEQQWLFEETLTRVTHDETRDTPALRQAIDQLAALPAIAPRRLIRLARLENSRLAVRDLALRALGRLDAGQGIPALLEALDDERARIAIYALRSSLLQMPAAAALALLRKAPMTRVTVAKEVVRLLGELAGGIAYADLLALDGRELHRDVRVALLRALWDHLEQPQTWPIFEQAAVSPDPAIADGVIRIPAGRRSPAALRRLVALLATLLTHPDPKLRLDTLGRCATLPISDAEQALLPALLAALGSPLPDERAAAAQAIFATYVGREAPLVGAAAAQLLPNRRALLMVVQSLRAALRWNRSRLLPTARAVLDALKSDPITATLQVELGASALPWPEVAELLRELATSDALHADALAAAGAALLGAATQRSDGAEIEGLEAALATEGDGRLRRLALAALVGHAQPPRGWDEHHLARLQEYRADPAALVAAAAQFTLPPAEEA